MTGLWQAFGVIVYVILIYGTLSKAASKDVDSPFPLNSNHSLSRPSFSAFVDSSMESYDVCLYHLTSHTFPSLYESCCAKQSVWRG